MCIRDSGKTTVAGGIAGTLAAMGRCVLLIDGDVGLGNLDLMLGIEGEACLLYTSSTPWQS